MNYKRLRITYSEKLNGLRISDLFSGQIIEFQIAMEEFASSCNAARQVLNRGWQKSCDSRDISDLKRILSDEIAEVINGLTDDSRKDVFFELDKTSSCFPWEAAFNSNDKPKCLMVRQYLDSPSPRKINLRVSHAMAWGNSSTNLLSADHEIESISNKFKRLGWIDETKQLEDEPLDSLMTALAHSDLLHFADHADSDSSPDWKKTTDTLMGSEQAMSGLPIVILANGCGTANIGMDRSDVHFPQLVLRNGCEVFVGTWTPVRDVRGREFAESFYSALLSNDTIGEAFQSTQNSLENELGWNWIEVANYVYYGNPLAAVTLETEIKRKNCSSIKQKKTRNATEVYSCIKCQREFKTEHLVAKKIQGRKIVCLRCESTTIAHSSSEMTKPGFEVLNKTGRQVLVNYCDLFGIESKDVTIKVIGPHQFISIASTETPSILLSCLPNEMKSELSGASRFIKQGSEDFLAFIVCDDKPGSESFKIPEFGYPVLTASVTPNGFEKSNHPKWGKYEDLLQFESNQVAIEKARKFILQELPLSRSWTIIELAQRLTVSTTSITVAAKTIVNENVHLHLHLDEIPEFGWVLSQSIQ